MFSFGCAMVALYVLGVVLSLVILLRLVPLYSPDLHFMSWVNIIGWLVTSPLAVFLLRFLRLRYWQPWTTPGQWEAGDETAPSWAPSWARKAK